MKIEMLRLYFFLFLFVISLNNTPSLTTMLGPADVIFKMLENCPDLEQTGGIDVSITKRKHNRTVHILDIALETDYEICNDLTVEFQGSLKKEGGYKEGSSFLKQPLCDGFHVTLGSVFDDFLTAIGFEDCPVAAGSYSVENFFIDNEKFSVPHVYGDHRMDILLWKNDDLIRCLRCYLEFIPKQT